MRGEYRTVRRTGNVLALRPNEFDLLLASRNGPVWRLSGRSCSRREGYQRGFMSRTIDMHMAELRRNVNEPWCIETVVHWV